MNELRTYFADRMRGLREWDCPRNLFTEWFGLSLASVTDLEQERVLPSRATVLLMHAIEMNPKFMREVARTAKPDLARLDKVRRYGPSAIK